MKLAEPDQIIFLDPCPVLLDSGRPRLMGHHSQEKFRLRGTDKHAKQLLEFIRRATYLFEAPGQFGFHV